MEMSLEVERNQRPRKEEVLQDKETDVHLRGRRVVLHMVPSLKTSLRRFQSESVLRPLM